MVLCHIEQITDYVIPEDPLAVLLNYLQGIAGTGDIELVINRTAARLSKAGCWKIKSIMPPILEWVLRARLKSPSLSFPLSHSGQCSPAKNKCTVDSWGWADQEAP